MCDRCRWGCGHSAAKMRPLLAWQVEALRLLPQLRSHADLPSRLVEATATARARWRELVHAECERSAKGGGRESSATTAAVATGGCSLTPPLPSPVPSPSEPLAASFEQARCARRFS